MHLKDYLYEKRIKTKVFAESMGYTQQALTMVFNGASNCSDKLAKFIEIYTHGAVTFEEMKAYSKEAMENRKATVALRKQKDVKTLEKIKSVCCKRCKEKISYLGLDE